MTTMRASRRARAEIFLRSTARAGAGRARGRETREHVERARAEMKCDVSGQPLRWYTDNLSSRSREMDEKTTKTGSREIRSRIN
jgi:hypothetical protein